MKGRAGKSLALFALWIGLFVILLVIDFPIINTVFTAFKTAADISHSPPKFIFTPVLDNFQYIFSPRGYNFERYVGNSIIVALASSMLAIAVAYPAGWAAVRLQGRLTKAVVLIALVFAVFPLIVVAMPLVILMSKVGLAGTRWALIIAHIFLMSPGTLLLLMGFFREVPREIEEAAVVDGASTWQLLTRVTLPIMVPGLASVFIMNIVASWNEYLFAVLLTSRNTITATVGATLFVGAYQILWGPMAAAITVATIPTLLFIFVSHRTIVRGMTMGALKG
jgi:multiple sugar transport system permease protein